MNNPNYANTQLNSYAQAQCVAYDEGLAGPKPREADALIEEINSRINYLSQSADRVRATATRVAGISPEQKPAEAATLAAAPGSHRAKLEDILQRLSAIGNDLECSLNRLEQVV